MMKRVNLPIDAFRDEILMCIKKNPVSIIVAETGAGKSTRVPQFLLESTNYHIVVTQPRRVAAKAVAKRVAEEMNCQFGGLVGFRTAVDRKDSDQTRCLFATDGLQLVRELTQAKESMNKGICLVIDEVHEWNLNIETLVAWAKRHISLGAKIKVVLMSATLDHERLSEFFDDAPVVQVPGRCFPVVGSPTHADGIIQKDAKSILDEIKRLTAEGSNTLVFLPGKGEIKQMENILKQANLSAVIVPLHGDVAPEEQELAFKNFRQPKVVLATNIAQTSLTIPDIDAVVDSGLERRVELLNNVETLTLGNISKADCRQRSGRAGRVKEGQYVLCNDTAYTNFAEYPIPEIQRSLLDQMVLRLASAGLDALELPFYHQPEKQTLVDAKELLYAIEALDQDGNITKLGRNINRFPTNVMSARMMLEALERKCLAPILTITAVMGTRYGSIRRKKRDNDPDGWKSWEELIDPSKKYHSDLLLEYDLFKLARVMKVSQLAPNGIDPKGFQTAFEIREQIKTAIQRIGYRDPDHSRNKHNETEVLKCIASGMLVHLYKHSGGDDYENGGTRQLDRISVLQKLSDKPKWIVGEPMNIKITNRRGRLQTISLVKTCTVVDPMWFVEIAPHLVETKVNNLRFDSELAGVVEDHIVFFKGTEIAREKKLAEYRAEVLDKFAYALANNSFSSDSAWRKINDANKEDMRRYQELRTRSGGTIEEINSSFLENHYKETLEKVLKDKEIKNLSLYVVEVLLGGFALLWIPLNSYLSAETENRILSENPDTVEIAGKKFAVTYQSGNNFIVKVTVDESFVQETDLERITLPNGRELTLVCGNYSGTLSEIRAKIEQARLEELERVQRILVNDFHNQISGILSIPSESPSHTGWSTTDLGSTLRNRFEALKVEMIEGLTLENSTERVEAVKAKAEEIKTELFAEYEKAQVLITSTEESFQKTSAEVEREFVGTEFDTIYNNISQAKTSLQKGEFTEVENFCRNTEIVIANLKNLAETKRVERNEIIKKSNVPEYLLFNAFGGDLDRALQFMSNVAKLETFRIDEHEITCGRSRASQNIDNAWRAMGEETDFFCGADTNDVKYFVYEHHFGGNSFDEGSMKQVQSPKEQSENNASSSNDVMLEALRKAGLID